MRHRGDAYQALKKNMKFSRTQKPNALKIKTKGSREKEFSPRFRVTTPRPPCIAPLGTRPK